MDHSGGKKERLDIVSLIQQAPSVENLPEFDSDWVRQSPRVSVDPVSVQKGSQTVIFRPYILALAATVLVIFGGLVYFFQRSFRSAGEQSISPVVSESQKSNLRAVVFYVDGPVFVIRNNQKKRMFIGDTLSRGDLVETSRGGEAGVVFGTGVQVTISPSSSVVLERLIKGGENRGNNVELKLNAGSLVNRIEKLESGASYRVHTPTAVAGVRGTVFLVKTNENGTDVITLEGRVELASIDSGESIVLNAGEAGKAGENRAPIQVAPADKEIQLIKRSVSLMLKEREMVKSPVLEAVSGMKALKSEDFQNVYGRDPEIIVLKDGRELQGVVASQTGDLLVVHSTEGVHLIRSGEIKEIRYVEVP